MTDVREQILARYFAVVADADPTVTIRRNWVGVSDDNRPAAMFWDGTADVEPADIGRSARRDVMHMMLRPALMLLPFSDPAGFTAKVSSWSRLVIPSVRGDSTLAALTANATGAIFEGLDIVPHPAAPQAIVANLRFAFPCVLRISNL